MPTAMSTLSRNACVNGGIGQNPAIACGHVTGGEVEARQLDTRVLDGADEGGDFGVRRRRGVERPPELDRLEAGVSGRARRSSSGRSVSRIEQLTV